VNHLPSFTTECLLPYPEESPVLEAWYREKLPQARFDISSSGVQPYRFGELRKLAAIGQEELDSVLLEDSLTLGGHSVRRAIADRYAAGEVARVMVTHGGSEAIALMMQALLAPGDRVVVADPIYHSLRTFPELQRCVVIPVPVQVFAEAQSITHYIQPGTKAVIVNFPHNPTGMSLNREARERLISRTEEVGSLLMWDAAMAELPMNASAPAQAMGLPSRTISFGSLSKAFGLPGLRVGWSVASASLLERTLPLRDRTTLFLSPLVELIAARAIEHADALIGPRLAQARANLSYVDHFILQRGGALEWQRPEGGVCGLVKIGGSRDTRLFCERLLDATGVLLVPGIAFGRPSHVRLGYGGDPVELREGLQLLSGFLRDYKE
jgi:capreomycidine synthase